MIRFEQSPCCYPSNLALVTERGIRTNGGIEGKKKVSLDTSVLVCISVMELEFPLASCIVSPGITCVPSLHDPRCASAMIGTASVASRRFVAANGFKLDPHLVCKSSQQAAPLSHSHDEVDKDRPSSRIVNVNNSIGLFREGAVQLWSQAEINIFIVGRSLDSHKLKLSNWRRCHYF